MVVKYSTNLRIPKFQVNLYGRLVSIYNVHTQLGLGKEYALELRQKYQKEALTKFSQ